MKKMTCIAFMLLLTAGCASDKAGKNGAETDYQTAKHKLDKGEYGDASLFLQDFGTKYPYSKYTVQAELLRLFAAYKGKQYVLSETLSKEFIERHPRHPNVDYAKYMLGMSLYRESAPADKDQEQTMKAVEAFRRLLRENPGSEYAKDGERHLQLLYNRLAGHELDVGKFYFDKGRYVAAANRFQVILEKYQTTPAIEEGLYYLAASFAKMGIKDNAKQTAMLLQHNYPNSEWARKAKPFL
jgi:outer membrane protein assembly factor BamD